MVEQGPLISEDARDAAEATFRLIQDSIRRGLVSGAPVIAAAWGITHPDTDHG